MIPDPIDLRIMQKQQLWGLTFLLSCPTAARLKFTVRKPTAVLFQRTRFITKSKICLIHFRHEHRSNILSHALWNSRTTFSKRIKRELETHNEIRSLYDKYQHDANIPLIGGSRG
jgi:hypothetical protein